MLCESCVRVNVGPESEWVFRGSSRFADIKEHMRRTEAQAKVRKWRPVSAPTGPSPVVNWAGMEPALSEKARRRRLDAIQKAIERFPPQILAKVGVGKAISRASSRPAKSQTARKSSSKASSASPTSSSDSERCGSLYPGP